MKKFPTGAFLVAMCLASSPATATDKEETFSLSKALYFNCSVHREEEPNKSAQLDIAYLFYTDDVTPQINVYDPTDLVTSGKGWASQEKFALTRLGSDRELFVWFGRNAPAGVPQIDYTIETAPSGGSADQTSVTINQFDSAIPTGGVLRKIRGQCHMISGLAAFNRSQVGVDSK